MIGKRCYKINYYICIYTSFRNDYYGGKWASFSLNSLQHLPNTQHFKVQEKSEVENHDEQFKYFGNDLFGIENFSFSWHVPE